jgi:hypothetical protein
MKHSAWAPVYCLAVLAAFSCSPDSLPLTQVMVVVDSDIAQVDSVRVRVEGMGDPKVATAEDLAKRPLPRTVAIVYRGGPLGPITVTADALAGKATLVSRRVEFSFVRGRNLTLTIVLEQSCVEVACEADGDTCIDGGCESAEVDSTRLSDWSGKTPSHRDAGASGGDAGVDDGGTGSGGGTPAGAGGRGGAGGQAGSRPAGQGGQGGAGTGGKPAAGSGGEPMVLSCNGCTFDPATTAPHGQLSCDNGTCLLGCDAGYTDADQARGNGCEKSASAFAWKTSNVDPSIPALTAAIVPTLMINCSATLDLGNAAFSGTVGICGQQLQPVVIPQRAGAPDVVVLATRHLTVTSGSTFRFAGARPVVIVVYGDAEIDGQLDVSAAGATGGPGSNFECTPGAGGNGANNIDEHAGGGGGGGFGTSGGSGATSSDGALGGPAGAASTDATLLPLRGGCSGGLGGKGEGATTAGGGGGGALQLSVAGRLRITGTIAAAGGGGQVGTYSAGQLGDGGGGGGSGGAILVEATKIETVSSAWLTTNGGGGGEGRVINNFAWDPGSDGAHASTDVAPGGSGSSPGGNGAAGSTPAVTVPPCASICGGGGGGGGLGRVVLRSADCQLGGSTTPAATCSAHVN